LLFYFNTTDAVLQYALLNKKSSYKQIKIWIFMKRYDNMFYTIYLAGVSDEKNNVCMPREYMQKPDGRIYTEGYG
jgi:hypothetical protein